MRRGPDFIDLVHLTHRFSSLIGCSFIAMKKPSLLKVQDLHAILPSYVAAQSPRACHEGRSQFEPVA